MRGAEINCSLTYEPASPHTLHLLTHTQLMHIDQRRLQSCSVGKTWDFWVAETMLNIANFSG